MLPTSARRPQLNWIKTLPEWHPLDNLYVLSQRTGLRIFLLSIFQLSQRPKGSFPQIFLTQR